MSFTIARARDFLAARLDSKKHLGFHLTFALLVACVAFWAFGALLDSVLDNATVVRLDTALHAWILARVTPRGVRFFDLVSTIGSPRSMQVVGAAGAAFLLWRRQRAILIAWLAALVGGAIIERVVKISVNRHRPVFVATHASIGPYSFPSGHAMWSFLVIGMLTYLIVLNRRPGRPWRPLVIGVGILIVGLIGVSRLYLGVHFPSDVLGGWIAAAAWLGTCASALAVSLHERQVSSSRSKR